MKQKTDRGRSKMPRINFEVPDAIKDAVIRKCHIEGMSQRTVGIGLFKEWLALPAVPEHKINVN